MTTFLENPLGSGGHTNRLIWSAPDPPQGDILYYNAKISSTGNGEVIVPFVDEIYTTELDIRHYATLNGTFSVQVYCENSLQICDSTVVFIVQSTATCIIILFIYTSLIMYISQHCKISIGSSSNASRCWQFFISCSGTNNS